MKLLLATRNRKKMEEIRRVFAHPGLVLLSLDDFPGCPEVEEDGESFRENAAKKALEVARFAGMSALADDSGLVVDGLDGAPGVRSARYAGEGADDAANLARVLAELAARPGAPRSARFVCDLALARPDGEVRHFTGSVEGRIIDRPLGVNGFGYDPVFVPEGHDETFAQMAGSQKDSMSHRGRALAACAAAIGTWFTP